MLANNKSNFSTGQVRITPKVVRDYISNLHDIQSRQTTEPTYEQTVKLLQCAAYVYRLNVATELLKGNECENYHALMDSFKAMVRDDEEPTVSPSTLSQCINYPENNFLNVSKLHFYDFQTTRLRWDLLSKDTRIDTIVCTLLGLTHGLQVI